MNVYLGGANGFVRVAGVVRWARQQLERRTEYGPAEKIRS